MKPNFFDMTVHDVDKAREFFGNVFDWKFEKLSTSDRYYEIKAGPDSEAGINGGIGVVGGARIAEGRPLTQISIPVADLESYVAKIKENGGYVLEDKTGVPGVGWYATCAEPGGLIFGLFQQDPNAT